MLDGGFGVAISQGNANPAGAGVRKLAAVNFGCLKFDGDGQAAPQVSIFDGSH